MKLEKPAKAGGSPMARSGPGRLAILAVVTAWLAVLVIPPWSLAGWRSRRLGELASPAVQADWDAFRDSMRRQAGPEGPVQRKVPRSPEPPELVWLRDYFPLAVVAWVALMGILGGVLGLLVLGVAGGDHPRAGAAKPPGSATGPGSGGP